MFSEIIYKYLNKYLNNNLNIVKNRETIIKKLIIVPEKKFLFLLLFVISGNLVFAQNVKFKNHNFFVQSRATTKPNKLNAEIAGIKWEKLNNQLPKETLKENIKWQKFDDNHELKKSKNESNQIIKNKYILGSLNRSIVFDDYISGPDISWLVAPGLPWNGVYAFDSSVRGYSRRKDGENFFGFNGGDAVGQFYYQFLRREKFSFGINLGVRSVYDKENDGKSGSPIGDGLSSGFRVDYKISDNSGFAFGGEQLLHFDGMTDTGRDIYATFSKGWWKNGDFPLHVATFGLATGKMAEGNIKGLCSDLLGGSGTEIAAQRSLCWAPVFSLSRVYNSKHSTFFEYNSKFFLLGQSFAPFEEIPIRGTLAIVLSDHIDNYKIHSFDELTWVFRIGIGF